jgi:hypothetical protein
MSAGNTQSVTLTVSTPGGIIRVDSAGVIVASAPGLLVTPWYVDARPVRGRFTLTHAASGLGVVRLPWCPHDVRRWALAAGWIGVDWRAPAFTVCASGPAKVFAWRLCDEWRPHCDDCPAMPVVDDHTAQLLRRAGQGRPR